MKKLILILLFSLLVISCTSSKRVSFLNVEELAAVKTVPVDLALYEEKYGEYDGVYLHWEMTIEHSGIKEGMPYQIGNKWSYSFISKDKYLVLNPEAKWLTTFRRSKIPDNLFIRATAPDGTSRQYGIEDLIAEEDNDGYKQYKFAIPDVVKGTIIEIAYDYEHGVHPVNASYFLDHETLLQSSIPIEHLIYSFAYPEWWRVKVKQLGADRALGYEELTNEENKKKMIRYESRDIPALTFEPYSPFYKEVARSIDLMIVDFAMMGGAYIHPGSWKSLGGRFRDYILKKSNKRSKLLEKEIRSLNLEKKTKLEQLEDIVDYVYKNIKLGKTQKANHNNILKNKEGNQHDITSLTQAMLEQAGIESSFMLVHDGQDGYFDKTFISGSQLYIPALRVAIETHDYIVCPYIKNLPVNHTPENLQGQEALMIAENEDGSWFWKTPLGNRAENAMDSDYQLTIDEDGKITIVETRTLRGSIAYNHREALTELSEEKTRKYISEMLVYTGGDLNFDKYEIENLDEYKLPLIITMNYTIDNMVTITPEEIIFQTGGLFSPLTGEDSKIEQEKRINPIKIAYDEQYNFNISITHPTTWKISSDLTAVQFLNDFGAIKSTFQTETGQLIIEQEIQLNKISAPKERISELAELTGSKSKLDIPTIIFSVESES